MPAKHISIGQIIDDAWSRYQDHFKALNKISLWFLLIPILPSILMLFSPDPTNPALTFAYVPGVSAGFAAGVFGFINWLTAALVTTWVTLNLINYVYNVQTGKAQPERKATDKSMRQFVSYIWISILKTLIILSPLLLIVPGFALLVVNTAYFVVPALSAIGTLATLIGVVAALVLVIRFSVQYYFPGFRLVTHEETGVNALKASKELTHGRFWATLVRIILPKLVFFVPFIIAEILATIAIQFALLPIAGLSPWAVLVAGKLDFVLNSFLSAGISMLLAPLIVLADYIVYGDLENK